MPASVLSTIWLMITAAQGAEQWAPCGSTTMTAAVRYASRCAEAPGDPRLGNNDPLLTPAFLLRPQCAPGFTFAWRNRVLHFDGAACGAHIQQAGRGGAAAGRGKMQRVGPWWLSSGPTRLASSPPDSCPEASGARKACAAAPAATRRASTALTTPGAAVQCTRGRRLRGRRLRLSEHICLLACRQMASQGKTG